ncbi:MAG: hypothetical protein IKO49_02065 [Bacilli bacterium]|nr:hypothetical protein [Clostridia bacterium]MBR4618066.1 hypothetical protein [Bacilli bacterium]
MSDLFSKYQHIVLNEDNAGSNYETYRGIIFDPENNAFKVVEGKFRDKKDMYEKMVKKGYVLRKCFEKRIFDWIEQNSPNNLIAYLMFSTAFSKWRNNNLLSDYYVKLLNDIPAINREGRKGDPQSRGKKDMGGFGEAFSKEINNILMEGNPFDNGIDWESKGLKDLAKSHKGLDKSFNDSTSEHEVTVMLVDQNGMPLKPNEIDPNSDKILHYGFKKKYRLFDNEKTDTNKFDDPRFWTDIRNYIQGNKNIMTHSTNWLGNDFSTIQIVGKDKNTGETVYKDRNAILRGVNAKLNEAYGYYKNYKEAENTFCNNLIYLSNFAEEKIKKNVKTDEKDKDPLKWKEDFDNLYIEKKKKVNQETQKETEETTKEPLQLLEKRNEASDLLKQAYKILEDNIDTTDENNQKEFENIQNEFSKVLANNKELFATYTENKQKYEDQNVPELEKKQKSLENLDNLADEYLKLKKENNRLSTLQRKKDSTYPELTKRKLEIKDKMDKIKNIINVDPKYLKITIDNDDTPHFLKDGTFPNIFHMLKIADDKLNKEDFVWGGNTNEYKKLLTDMLGAEADRKELEAEYFPKRSELEALKNRLENKGKLTTAERTELSEINSELRALEDTYGPKLKKNKQALLGTKNRFYSRQLGTPVDFDEKELARFEELKDKLKTSEGKHDPVIQLAYNKLVNKGSQNAIKTFDDLEKQRRMKKNPANLKFGGTNEGWVNNMEKLQKLFGSIDTDLSSVDPENREEAEKLIHKLKKLQYKEKVLNKQFNTYLILHKMYEKNNIYDIDNSVLQAYSDKSRDVINQYKNKYFDLKKEFGITDIPANTFFDNKSEYCPENILRSELDELNNDVNQTISELHALSNIDTTHRLDKADDKKSYTFIPKTDTFNYLVGVDSRIDVHSDMVSDADKQKVYDLGKAIVKTEEELKNITKEISNVDKNIKLDKNANDTIVNAYKSQIDKLEAKQNELFYQLTNESDINEQEIIDQIDANSIKILELNNACLDMNSSVGLDDKAFLKKLRDISKEITDDLSNLYNQVDEFNKKYIPIFTKKEEAVYVNQGVNTLDNEEKYGDNVFFEDINQSLNEKLFDLSNDKLKSDVKEALLKVAETFKQYLDLPFEPIDIYFTGSNANYNYNDQSDIDLHLVFDFEQTGMNAEMLSKYLKEAKTVFNSKYDIKIKGLPVEVGCENKAEPLVTSGIYSVINDYWVIQPTNTYCDKSFEQAQYDEITNEIEDAIETKDSSTIGALWKMLGKLRKDSLASEGEYGSGNLLFKKLRNMDYLKRLKDAYYNSASRELSLEAWDNDLNDTDISDEKKSSEGYMSEMPKTKQPKLRDIYNKALKQLSEEKANKEDKEKIKDLKRERSNASEKRNSFNRKAIDKAAENRWNSYSMRQSEQDEHAALTNAYLGFPPALRDPRQNCILSFKTENGNIDRYKVIYLADGLVPVENNQNEDGSYKSDYTDYLNYSNLSKDTLNPNSEFGLKTLLGVEKKYNMDFDEFLRNTEKKYNLKNEKTIKIPGENRLYTWKDPEDIKIELIKVDTRGLPLEKDKYYSTDGKTLQNLIKVNGTDSNNLNRIVMDHISKSHGYNTVDDQLMTLQNRQEEIDNFYDTATVEYNGKNTHLSDILDKRDVVSLWRKTRGDYGLTLQKEFDQLIAKNKKAYLKTPQEKKELSRKVIGKVKDNIAYDTNNKVLGKISGHIVRDNDNKIIGMVNPIDNKIYSITATIKQESLNEDIYSPITRKNKEDTMKIENPDSIRQILTHYAKQLGFDFTPYIDNIWLYYYGEDYVPEMVTLETINVDPETKYPYFFNLKSTEIEKDPGNSRSKTRHVKVVTPDEFKGIVTHDINKPALEANYLYRKAGSDQKEREKLNNIINSDNTDPYTFLIKQIYNVQGNNLSAGIGGFNTNSLIGGHRGDFEKQRYVLTTKDVIMVLNWVQRNIDEYEDYKSFTLAKIYLNDIKSGKGTTSEASNTIRKAMNAASPMMSGKLDTVTKKSKFKYTKGQPYTFSLPTEYGRHKRIGHGQPTERIMYKTFGK